MLIALMTILFLGGSTSGMLDFLGDTKDTVKTVMPTDDRQKAALDTVKAMKKKAEALNKQVRRSSKNLSKVLKTDNVTDADIEAIWSVYYTARSQYSSDMLDLRYELKEQLSREEWAQIFPVE